MYTISANSTEILLSVREHYRNIETSLQLCQTTAERNYVEGTEMRYEQLQECLGDKGYPKDSEDNHVLP